MIEPWPSTQSRPPFPRQALGPLDDEPFGRAGDEVRDDGIDGDSQPAIAIPVCPVGTKIEARPRRRASRSSSSATVIFPIAQSDPTVSTTVPGTSRFAPVAVDRSAGGRRRSRSWTSWRAASSSQLGIVGEEDVKPVLDVEPVDDAAAQDVHPRRWESAALRGDPDERRVRLEAERIVDGRDDRHALLRLARARVESRIATTSSRR